MTPLIALPHWRAPTWERTKFYYDSLLGAGAEYVLVDGEDLPREAAGLLLTGGVDVNPKLYAERRDPRTERSNRKRDRQELGLLQQALERDIAILCICRGHQLLNVAVGGSVLQNIDGDGHRWHLDTSSRWHGVKLEPGSRIADVYGDGAVMRVNSRHHQGITPERLAPSLRATALSPDGLVECAESTDHRWVLGVQWHPERPEMHPAADPLFEAFTEAAAVGD